MPTYEYACRECGQHLEVVQSFTEDPLTTCASCGGQLRKVFSAAGIIFKGSGYYVTDSRTSAATGKADAKGAKEAKAKAAGADSGSGSAGEDSGSSSGSGASSGSDSASGTGSSGSSGSASGGEAKSA